MTKKLSGLLLLASLIAGGCSLAPDYVRPQAPIAQSWASQTDAKAPVATEMPWQKFFVHGPLRELVALALENNRDLRLASLNVERARGLYGIQRAELFPAVNASASYSKQRLPDTTGFGRSLILESYAVNLGVSAWEIDFFGRIRSLKDQALEIYFSREEARRGAQISLVAEVARAYLTLAADEENRALTQKTFDTRQQALGLIQKSLDIGYATELDLRQAQIPVDAARLELARFAQQIEQDKNALNLLAGQPVPAELLPSTLDQIAEPAAISAGLPSEVLLQRPDILAAEHQLKGAYAFLGAARAAFFPRISLTSNLGTASSELAGLFGAGTQSWLFAPTLSLPIFDARTWAAHRVSQTDRDIALAQYEKAIQTAFREVADALAVQAAVGEQLDAQQALAATTADVYRLAELRYTHGLDNYLGVLDAQRALFTAQQNLVSVRLARAINQIRLFAVLGGGAEQTEIVGAVESVKR